MRLRPEGSLRRSSARVALALSLIAPVLGGASGPVDTTDPTSLLPVVRVPGLAMAVIDEGEVSAVRLFGLADADSAKPVTEETLFEAASLTKPLFATVVLRLAERGEFDLDRPLHQYLASERLAHDPRSRQLTARIVLSHRTGLPNWGPDRLEFEFAPGERFGYSGEGYQYLQQVVEEVTGSTLDQLARREIFEPLGLVHSRLSWEESATPVLAAPHDMAGMAGEKRQVREAMAAATLHTTAEEYAKFMAAWMGGRLLRPRTMAMALEPVARIEPVADDPEAQRAAGRRIAWGLGWGLQLPAGDAEGVIAMHWGDNGDFKAFAAFDPRARSGVVYFANGANGLAIGEALAEPVVGDLTPTFDWLGYGRWDDPGEGERLAGVAAAAGGRHEEAIDNFRAALAAGSEDDSLARRIEWLEDLIELRASPVEVPVEILERWVGRYGPRTIAHDGDSLVYARDGRPPYRLIPLSPTLFLLEGETDFRLEIGLDAAGQPVKLIGRYVNGHVDESPRDSG